MNTNIGERWKPGHVERRDSESGSYEEINPPMSKPTDQAVQQALLLPAEKKSWLMDFLFRKKAR